MQLGFTAVCTREVTDRAGQPFILSPFSHCLRYRSGPWRKDGEKEEGQGKKTNRRLHLFVPQEESWSLHSLSHYLWLGLMVKEGYLQSVGLCLLRKTLLNEQKKFWQKEFLCWMLVTTQWFLDDFETFVCSGTLNAVEWEKWKPRG